MRKLIISLVPSVALVFACVACRNKAPEPEPSTEEKASEPAKAVETAKPTETANREAAGKANPGGASLAEPGRRKVEAKPVKEVTPSADDPVKGKFTLAEAIKGMPEKGKLMADIDSDAGKLECELYDDKAPITVANFVGLARGLRPWKNTEGNWVKKPAYDGLTFHRVIKGFMIQGGDPAGNGSGEPGYVIPDEIWEDAHHDQRGLICMANRGPNTNGMQFFIMDGVASHLDGGYTIFGKCGPDAVIEKLSSTEVRGDRAVNPPKIKKVSIRRAK